MWKQCQISFWGVPKSTQTVIAVMKFKKCLLLERITMTNLYSILKSKTLLTKVRIVKTMLFTVVMYGCERWTIKKTKCQKWMFSNCGAEEDS